MLNGSAHGEEGVRDDLQTLRWRSKAGDPGRLHLRQSGHLAQATEHESRHRVGTRGKALSIGPATDTVVQKYLVHDQGQVMLAANFFDGCPFRRVGEVSGWIVRVNYGDGSGARGDAPAQCIQIEVPAEIVEERIRNEAYVVQLGKKIKQWITRLPDQHLIARIAEQAEEKTVGFACTGGEKDLVGIHGGCVVTVVAADSLAGRAQASGIRLVLKRAWVLQRRKNRRSIVGEAATGGVGCRQVEEPGTFRTQPSELLRPGRLGQIPPGSRRPPHRFPPLAAWCNSSGIISFLLSGARTTWICKP